MQLTKENDRKGLVATIFIHVILFLLMLIWNIGRADEMLEAQQGVEVSFGDPESGMTDNTSEVAESSESEPQPSSSADEVEAPPTPDPSVVTNDQVDAPEIKTAPSKPTPKVEENMEPAKVNDALKSRLEKLKNQKSNSDQNKSAGDKNKPGPGGDPNADKPGPGGTSTGNMGGGVGYSLQGFNAKGTPLENERQIFGKVIMKVELDQKGNVTSIRYDGGTTADPYLIELATKSIKQFQFVANGSEKGVNIGTFTFTYKPR